MATDHARSPVALLILSTLLRHVSIPYTERLSSLSSLLYPGWEQDDDNLAKVDNAKIEFNSTYVRRNYLKTTSNCQINWKYVAVGFCPAGTGALFMG